MYDYTYYDYGYDYGYQAASGLAAGLLVFGIIMWIIGIAVGVITIISMWKVFTKAGKPGWAAIIPIYNIIVMLEISELPMWYIALYFVPGANIYAMIKINIEIAHKFGKSTGFGVGMALLQPVFYALLAFNKNVNFVGNNNVQNVQPTQFEQPVPYVEPVQQSVAPVIQEQPVNFVQPEVTQPVVPQVQPAVEQSMLVPEEQPVSENVQPEINQAVAPAFCTNCGSPLIPNTKFCTNCGKQI